MRLQFPFILALCFSTHLHAKPDKDLAVRLMNSGKIKESIEEFKKVSEEGDTIAMVTIGNFYYEGRGVSQNYVEAMNWYLRAYQANADALCNIGVLFRDGKGVKQNLQIAYCIFILIHMKGAGSADTQIRNGSNLKKTIALLTQDEMKSALCITEEYLEDYIKSRGNLPADYSVKGQRFKDKNWWLPGELPKYDCPCATGK